MSSAEKGELDRIINRLYRGEITKAQADQLGRRLAARVRKRLRAESRVPSRLGGMIRSGVQAARRSGGAVGETARRLGRRTLGAGGIVSAVIAAASPNELGSGELTPAQRRELERDRQRAHDAAIDALGVELPPGVARVPGPRGTRPTPGAVMQPFPQFPAPQPRPTTSSRARVGTRARQIASQVLSPATLLNVLDSRGRGRAPLVNVYPPATAPLPAMPPGSVVPGTNAVPLPLGLTAFDATRVGSNPQRTCQCRDKRKSERRKCKERATVKWASGRRKGQKAGTKCVVYHQLGA